MPADSSETHITGTPPEQSGIIIAGAGIAGMVAALALAKHNIPSAIYEKSAVLQEVGAGIQLAPNATRLLRGLGLFDAIAPYLAEPDFINLNHAGSGKTLLRLPIKAVAEKRWRAPYFTIHRADFQTALKEEIDKNPLIRYFGGHGLSSISGNAQTGFLAQPAAAENAPPMPPVKAGRILCCDGVWSRLRAAQTAEQAHFSSYIAWRATLKAEDLPPNFVRQGALNAVSAYMSKNSHFIIYPLRGGTMYNFVIVTKGQAGGKGMQRGDKADLLRIFGGQNPLLRALIEHISVWTYWPLYQMPFPRFLGNNGEIFLGDAAHAVTPFAAQGAAQAIEDACVLAQALADGRASGAADSDAAALARFNAIRLQRLKAVAKRGGFNCFVYHLSGPAAFTRNFFMQLRPQNAFLADLDWLYGYDAVAAFTNLRP